MSFEDLVGLLSFFTVSLGIRIFLLTFIFFYLVLALITLRQTQLMLRVLDEVSFSPFLKFLALGHFIAALSVFVLALILFMF